MHVDELSVGINVVYIYSQGGGVRSLGMISANAPIHGPL